MKSIALLAQVDPRALQALERIAVAQIVMAAIMALFGLVLLAATVIALLQLRAARRQLVAAANDLKPKLAPLIDRAKEATGDVAGMTDSVRRKVDDILHTVEDLHRAVKRGSEGAEERLRRFTAVLDVVQEETEELLLDAAATAHGMHETARVLREPRGRPEVGPPAYDKKENEDE
jgi:methyl-accepting chemotaxis protein